MERIQQLRRELGLTQKEFAEKLGVYQPEVSRMESDETTRLTIRQLHLVCNTFNVSPVWLDHGVGDMFKQEPKKNLQAVVDVSAPFHYALRKGLGYETARAFDTLCNLPPEYKERIEKILTNGTIRAVVAVLFGVSVQETTIPTNSDDLQENQTDDFQA